MLGILSNYGCILCGHVVDLMAVGDTGFSPPTAAVKFVWAIRLTTLEDGKILANIC